MSPFTKNGVPIKLNPSMIHKNQVKSAERTTDNSGLAKVKLISEVAAKAQHIVQAPAILTSASDQQKQER